MMMPEAWWACAVLPGRQRKSGSSERATFMRKVPEPDFRARKRRLRSGASTLAGKRSRTNNFGATLAATARARMTSPEASRTPPAPPVPHPDPSHGRPGSDARTARQRRACHGLADGAHAAQRVPPDAKLAVHFTKAVVQQHVGRAGRGGAGVGANDAVEGQGALDH